MRTCITAVFSVIFCLSLSAQLTNLTLEANIVSDSLTVSSSPSPIGAIALTKEEILVGSYYSNNEILVKLPIFSSNGKYRLLLASQNSEGAWLPEPEKIVVPN